MNSRYLYILLILSLLCADTNNIEVNKSRQSAITYAIKNAKSSVVGINVVQVMQQSFDPFFDPFFHPFHRQDYEINSLGSGVIVSYDGYIITNAHVIEDATEIVVSIITGDTFTAEVIGVDELTDIALIKIECNGLSPATLGDSDDLIIGEWVIALGNPLGLFDVSNEPTATAGIISGVNMDFGQKNSGRVYQDMIQTDASINPGNSGGPLINSNAEIIGINTFIMTNSNYNQGSIGIGFAIPINQVNNIVKLLKEYGEIDRSYTTGLHVQPLDRAMKQYLNIENLNGVIITDVDSKSSGERAGLFIGDIIISVGEKSIKSKEDILQIIDEGLFKTGDFIPLGILRNGNNLTVQLELKAPN